MCLVENTVESGSNTAPIELKTVFKIHVVDGASDRKKNRWTFMVPKLRTLSEIECEVLQRRPELRFKKLNFYYYDQEYDKIQIANARDFDLFLALQIGPNIFVSYKMEKFRTPAPVALNDTSSSKSPMEHFLTSAVLAIMVLLPFFLLLCMLYLLYWTDEDIDKIFRDIGAT